MQCLIVYLLSLFVFDLGLSSVGISEIWITEYGPDSGQSGVFFGLLPFFIMILSNLSYFR